MISPIYKWMRGTFPNPLILHVYAHSHLHPLPLFPLLISLRRRSSQLSVCLGSSLKTTISLHFDFCSKADTFSSLPTFPIHVFHGSQYILVNNNNKAPTTTLARNGTCSSPNDFKFFMWWKWLSSSGVLMSINWIQRHTEGWDQAILSNRYPPFGKTFRCLT